MDNCFSVRKQRVIVNESHSQWAEVTSGVPQGSGLGPILFLLYINSMSNGVTSKMFYFADDAKIYRAITNLAEHEELQKDLYKLKKWSNGGDLGFNLSKCHQLTLSLRTIPPNRTYSLDGTTPLTRVNQGIQAQTQTIPLKPKLLRFKPKLKLFCPKISYSNPNSNIAS